MKLLRLALLATLLISFNNAWSATLTESPANVAQGGTATVTWSAVAAPTNVDWIGLYAPAGVDTAYLDWIYINSCSKSAGAFALAGGSCSFLIPGSLANGLYQFRLYAANGYSRLATSGSFNIGPVAPSTRFVDNGDGTISDTQTGLMWEKKTGSVGSPVGCSILPNCPDPHDVNNAYSWSTTTAGNPDGSLFTNFLTRINTELSTSSDAITVVDVCFAGHCDWRMPNIAELRTIELATCPGGNSPCIDPTFGPTNVHLYWSSTTVAGSSGAAWTAAFGTSPGVIGLIKDAGINARAVRGDR